MTRRSLVLPLLAVWAFALIEPIVPTQVGGIRWLVDFTPIFITYACLRLSPGALFFFLALGSLGLDFLIPDRPGTSPLLWALVAFLVRSQQPWIRGRSWVMLSVMTFAASCLYAFGDRTFFLMANDLWSWSYLLLLKLILLSAVNALLTPIAFTLMDRLCGVTRPRPKDPEFSPFYATR